MAWVAEPHMLGPVMKNYRELKFARTLIYTLEKINNDKKLLPGILLGYKILNACGSLNLMRAVLKAVSEEDVKEGCAKVHAFIGHSSSGPTQKINNLISPFGIPQISHLSTCACLSNRDIYPTFFRTVPSDHFQVIALVQLMKQFGWNWIGLIYSYGSYGENGAHAFMELAKKEGICVEYQEMYLQKYSDMELNSIVNVIKNSTSKVILAFMSSSYIRSFLSRIDSMNITGKHWMGSEAWVTAPDLASIKNMHILQGTMGFAIPEAKIPGLTEFLLKLKPSDAPDSAFIRDFWETTFQCSLSASNQTQHKRLCNGSEDLRTIDNDYTDTSESRTVNNVYNAVYAVAHALHNLLQCNNGTNPVTGYGCYNKTDIQPLQVVHSLRKVNFSLLSGGRMFFDENGDSVALYDLVNWQMNRDGSINIVNIGRYDGSLPNGKRFQMKENITVIWGGNHSQVPRSVCTESCPPGNRKVMNKTRQICCFDCLPCADGEIANKTDSSDCMKCPPAYWSNKRKDECVLKLIEFLSYGETMGMVLVIFSCFGFFFTLFTTVIFFAFRKTAIVRANNSELSFLLLFSLKLCFLCSLTFIGRPSEWSCMLRHTAFGITFVLCISCVLGKTIVVLMAFRATLPGSNVMKWFGPLQQRLSVLGFTLIQVLICVLWLTISPPFPYRNMNLYQEKIILECELGSAVGFWAVLGYIGILAVLCFILAFLARKLPDNFNEAKYITFSMLIFCAVWITFIPAYVSSPGKFTVAVEIFAILASSFGLLSCIFFPKCYVIVFKPQLNSKKHVIGKITSKSL
ncbi:extracellular calcium-sensing receptor-like [Alosa alosa]|uniref:extracellular calcium-sensing receptor-like n=1 Tax=Alosa alosa TaxID=278164 RepID=UPI00201525D6|nr:extracellular calcium-sensing receptor-like [Alosa alosa]